MTINSMTGFARADGAHGAVRWHWEARSVNGRGLDVRLRLAPGSESLEPKVREAVARRFVRGSIAINLFTRSEQAATQIRLNEAALEQVLKAAERVRHLTGCELPRAEHLLSIKGVEPEDDEATRDARAAAMLASLEVALGELAAAREGEGARLRAVLVEHVGEIERLVTAAATSPGRSAEAVRARLQDQLARLLDASQALDPQRLEQEAALLATRADIEEELKRLTSHIAAARELIGAPGAIGRKLDFLAQEFNREANTLCAKANDTELVRIGLALKAVIDQMREQVQNIE
jgi:uncharacterized protein (TIGR00255 family)